MTVRAVETDLKADIQDTEIERLADLLEDMDIARIIEARRGGRTIRVTLADSLVPGT